MYNKWGVEKHSSYINLENAETEQTLTLDTKTDRDVWDVLVVGGGGAGTACASEAARLGLSVMMLQGERGGAGAAGANAGFLLCGGSLFYHEAEIAWGTERTRRVWELSKQEIANQRLRFGDVIKLTGSYRTPGDDLESGEEEDIKAQFAAMTRAGIEVQMCQVGEVEALRVIDDGWCDPVERLAYGWRELLSNGGAIETTSNVSWRKLGGVWVVTDGHREWRCEQLVVASDGHLERQIPALQGKIETHRLQMLRASKPGLFMDEPTYMRWGYDYGINHLGRLHLGGKRDKFADEERSDKWDGRCDTSMEVQQSLETLAEKLCGEKCEIEWRWAGPVGYTEGGLPVAGEIESNLWVTGGYNGHGNLLSWILGREIASEIAGFKGDLLSEIGI